MNYLVRVKNFIALRFDLLAYSIFRPKYFFDKSFSEATKKFLGRNDLHSYMCHYFKYLAPKPIKAHRQYFKKNLRGFGEDAFHAMWNMLLKEFKPKLALEIGVYRGQIISLWALIAKQDGFECKIHGISPFSPAGDRNSVYLDNLNYLEDVIHSHNHFSLPTPTLLKAYSTDQNAVDYIKSKSWDLIYIDGNHDYEVALKDYELSRDSLAPGGILVMDDSSLYTDYKPPRFSFSGHPGPSKIVLELAMKEMQFLGGVGHNNIFMKV